MKYLLIFTILFLGCGESNTQKIEPESARANVKKVTIQGNQNNYTFSVTLHSDETGCKQYTDWWEVLKADSTLVYRRILIHSHPDEQPFTRSGSSIDILEDEKVYIRAHMNNKGYTGDVFVGSVKNGFSLASNPPNFAKEIEIQKPLPDGCAF